MKIMGLIIAVVFLATSGLAFAMSPNTSHIYAGSGSPEVNQSVSGTCAECPPGSQVEGEPVCGPDYVDAWNGGCNWDPYRFQDVTCGLICGETGTYLFGGNYYRDTDWFLITVNGPTTYRGIGDGFPLRIFVLPAVCPVGAFDTAVTSSCVWSSLLVFGPGTYYLWAGPDVFDGVPCGSKYLLEVRCETPNATEPTSWAR